MDQLEDRVTALVEVCEELQRPLALLQLLLGKLRQLGAPPDLIQLVVSLVAPITRLYG